MPGGPRKVMVTPDGQIRWSDDAGGFDENGFARPMNFANGVGWFDFGQTDGWQGYGKLPPEGRPYNAYTGGGPTAPVPPTAPGAAASALDLSWVAPVVVVVLVIMLGSRMKFR